MSEPSWPKKLFFYSVLILVAFALVEGGLRAYFALRVGPSVLLYGTGLSGHDKLIERNEKKHTVQKHENVGQGYSKYHPNQIRFDYDIDTEESFRVGINQHGFRGPDFEVEKIEGVTRVLTLGSSSTFGYFNRDEDVYPRQLERLLRERCASREFEVINLGIPHLKSEEVLALFRAEGLSLSPDIVTFYEGINDASRQENATRRELKKAIGGTSFVLSVYRFLRDHLITVAAVDGVVLPGLNTYTRADLEKQLAGKSELYLANLSELRGEVTAGGAILIVSTQQARSMSLEGDPLKAATYQEEVDWVKAKLEDTGELTLNELCFLVHANLMADVRGWIEANDVPWVDVIAALDDDRSVVRTWVHPDARGNRLIAEAFSDQILRRVCADRDGNS